MKLNEPVVATVSDGSPNTSEKFPNEVNVYLVFGTSPDIKTGIKPVSSVL